MLVITETPILDPKPQTIGSKALNPYAHTDAAPLSTIGALTIRTGFWCALYYTYYYDKEPPK